MSRPLANDVLVTFVLRLDGHGSVKLHKRRDGTLAFTNAHGFPVVSHDNALYKLLEALQAAQS
jgi:hypothetical protein